MVKPIFVLGVGAQKSATTWLHKQLRTQIFADFGFTKEYHIWDAMFLPQCEQFLIGDQYGDWFKPVESYRKTLQLMQTQDNVYEHYFKSLLSDSVFMTGDFTPAYSMLKAEHFLIIKNRLENAGFDVKVIFQMRDPVERIWSSIRMRQATKNLDKVDFWKYVSQVYKSNHIVERARYDKTILELNAVFDSSNIHFDFFERLFEPAAVDRLNKFLGVELQNINPTEKVNPSNHISIPEYLTLECRDYYAEVYDFCNNRFPETRQLWKHS